MPALFSVPIFFILLRETLEAAIIVSVLLAIIDKLAASSARFKTLAGPLRRRVWLGTLSGLLLSLAIGAAFLAVWYKYAVDLWAKAEALWEGIFSIISAVMVGVTAIAMLKSSRLYEKYAAKLARKLGAEGVASGSLPAGFTSASAIQDAAGPSAGKTNPTIVLVKNDSSASSSNAVQTTDSDDQSSGDGTVVNAEESQVSALSRPLKALFWLPFITVLREGLEAVVFIGGVSLGEEPSSIPIAAIVGIIVGIAIGFIVHRGGTVMKLHWFFVATGYILLLIADGLLSRGIGNFEDYTWGKAINLEADDVGTGAFDPRRTVWHFNCCSPENKTQGWGIFNSLLGWRNNATIATVTGYCLFWVLAAGALVLMRMKEDRDKLKDGDDTANRQSSAVSV
ncbi:high-affinity iron permease [Polyrhizophydium stewartii]|uniref:High-affinity iron permease n=1 Tax=Polyrhizophydium stewartii TaxID=2732419 RepID=A0ABR4N3Z5_9FUNG